MMILRLLLTLALLATPAGAALQNNNLIGFGVTSAGTGTTCTEITDYSGYTIIGDMTLNGGIAASFNNSASPYTAFQAAASASRKSSDGYVGIDFGAGNLQKVCKVVVYSTSNACFNGDTVNITWTAYGNTSAPGSGTDGTSVGTTGSIACVNSDTQTVTSTDQVTEFRYVWGNLAAASGEHYNAQMRIWTLQ